MAVFGWIILTALALIIAVAGVVGLVVSRGFTGKADPGFLVYLSTSAGLFYLSYLYCPFSIMVHP